MNDVFCFTLFLDEVDTLTPKAQVTLLRFLQDQLYRPLGGSGTQAADVRIVVASTADLIQLAEQGVFRMDLLKQSGEMLAGRIAYCELSPITVSEYPENIDQLWLRGGFPDSLLAASDQKSLLWRNNFIRAYLDTTSRNWGHESMLKPFAVSGRC